MAVVLAAVAVGAIIGSAVAGIFQGRELNKANAKIAANNIEIIKFQSKQQEEAINESRSMLEGQITASAATSGVSIGSVSVTQALTFNATQRGKEIGNLLIEEAAAIRGQVSGAQVGALQTTSQARGQALGAVGQAASASQAFFR